MSDWARRYALRNVAFAVSSDAMTYGSQNYGDGTYGQESTDPLPNIEYVLAPSPGEWPTSVDWVYRVNDHGNWFRAKVLGLDGELSVHNINAATLVIDRMGPGPLRAAAAFPLTMDESDNTLAYRFQEGDLLHSGVYRAIVQVVFLTSRTMSITADDSATFIIRDVTD